jgi:N-acetylneuraminic acid mutarotase
MTLPPQRYLITVLVLSLAACRDAPSAPEAVGPNAEAPSSARLGSWQTRRAMPSDRINVATAVVTDGQGRTTLYAIGGKSPTSTAPIGSGGLSKVQAYDSQADTWVTRAPLPHPLQLTNGAVTIRGKIYVSGGVIGYKLYSDELLVYDPAANTWTTKAAMPRTTYRGTSAVIDNRLYVLTSCSQQEDCYPSVFPDVSFYRYDPATDRWTSLPLPPSGHPHINGVAGAIGKKFYVVGGTYDGDQVLEVYDPATNSWSTRTPMFSRRSLAAGATADGKLYVIAGFVATAEAPGFKAVPTTSMFDPATNTWRNLAPAPFTGGGLSAGRVVVNGLPRIEVVGGARPENNRQFVP